MTDGSSNVPVWLSLAVPAREDAAALVRAALASGAPLDISSSPAFWGGQMRGTEAPLMVYATTAIEQAVDQEHASDMIQAHVIETLVSIGREYIDFYVIRAREALLDFQLEGALAAMQAGRDEDHVRFFGISIEDAIQEPRGLDFSISDSIVTWGTSRSELIKVKSEADVLRLYPGVAA